MHGCDWPAPETAVVVQSHSHFHFQDGQTRQQETPPPPPPPPPRDRREQLSSLPPGRRSSLLLLSSSCSLLFFWFSLFSFAILLSAHRCRSLPLPLPLPLPPLRHLRRHISQPLRTLLTAAHNITLHTRYHLLSRHVLVDPSILSDLYALSTTETIIPTEDATTTSTIRYHTVDITASSP